MAGVFPVAFIVLSYMRFGRETALVAILARLTASIVLYLAASYLMLCPMFTMIFAGAHIDPVGNSLSVLGKILIASLVFVYGVFNYLLASFVRGRLILFPNQPRLR